MYWSIITFSTVVRFNSGVDTMKPCSCTHTQSRLIVESSTTSSTKQHTELVMLVVNNTMHSLPVLAGPTIERISSSMFLDVHAGRMHTAPLPLPVQCQYLVSFGITTTGSILVSI